MFDIIGWVGASLILFAYFQAARNVWPTSGLVSAVINAAGAIALGIAAASHGSWPNVGMEVAFILVAFFTIRRNLREVRKLPADFQDVDSLS